MKLKSFLILFLISFNTMALDPKGLDRLMKYLVQPQNDDLNTESFTLIHNGEVVYEKYFTVNPEDRHILWSMSKTITAMIFGIAESEGLISRNDKVSKFYPGVVKHMDDAEKKKYADMTLYHLLTMSSGLDWNEYYERAPFASHVVRMLYVEGSKDTVKYVLKTPLKYEPGTRFHYSSGDTNVIMGALKKSMDEKTYINYPWVKFFDPLGIDAIFERDGTGTFFGASYVYMKTKDLIKLGQLILNKGKFNGKQVVPAKFVEEMITQSDVFKKNCEEGGFTYGFQIWLNQPCPGSNDNKLPDAPTSLIMYLGHGGQSIYIYPEHNVMAVRFAHDTQGTLDRNKYAKLVLEAVGK
jgi:CubicO group peptidase (beta-lactamase class C family)